MPSLLAKLLQPALPDLPGAPPVHDLPPAPNIPGQGADDGEAIITMLLLLVTAAVLTCAVYLVLTTIKRGLTGERETGDDVWPVMVSFAGAVAIMYAASEPMFALFRIVSGPIWLAIIIASVIALLAVIAAVIWEKAQDILAWAVFIGMVLLFNFYFDWNIWWSIGATFAICLAMVPVLLLAQKFLTRRPKS